MKVSFYSFKPILILLVSFLFVNSFFSQDRKVNKAIEHIELQRFDDAEEVISTLKKKNATLPTTYFVQSMLYGSKTFKRYNIDSSFIFYNQAIEGLKSLEIKELTDICTDFKLCLSRSQIVKDSIAEIAFNQYKTAKSIEKMKTFNSLYKGTASIQQSNELIENLYYKIAIETNTTEGYTDFLKMYPNNAKRDFILSKVHKIEYDLAVSKNEKSVYKNYLNTYPTSEFCDEVRNNIEKIDYTKTKSSLEIIDFEEFMNAYPNSNYAQEILTIYETLYYNDALNKREISQLNKFKMRYPTSRYIGEINATICDIAFENVKRINTINAFKEFVKLYPNSKYDKEAKDKIIELFPIVPKLLSNGKYIYIDKFSGADLFGNEYDKVTLFENNQAIVMQNSKYGVINENGRVIIPFQYDEIYRCTNPDLYRVTINNKSNVINNEGRKLLKADYDIDFAYDNNDFIGYNNKDKEYSQSLPDYVYRIVDKQLVSYQCPYDDFPYFDSTGRAIVTKGKKDDYDNPSLGIYSLINRDFQEIIPFKYNYITEIFSHPGLYFFNIGAEAVGVEGGFAPEGGKWGVMNASGKVLIPAIFDGLSTMDLNNLSSDIYFTACNSGSCGLIDIKGNEILPFEYQDLYNGISNQLIARKGDKWGVIDNKNNVKIPFIYDEINPSKFNYVVSKYTNTTNGDGVPLAKFGIVSTENKLLLPLKYDYINAAQDDNVLSVSLGCLFSYAEGGGYFPYAGKWGLLNQNAAFILNPTFSDIYVSSDTSLIFVNTGKIYGSEFPGEIKYEGKYGLSNKQGKLILPIKFDEIIVASELIFAKYAGKFQVYTKTGEMVLDSKIDEVRLLDNNFLVFRKGEKFGILKPDGSELIPPKFWAKKYEDGSYSIYVTTEGPYFKIEEADQQFYVTKNGDILRD